MSSIETIVVRAILERATPIPYRVDTTPRFRRDSPPRSLPVSVVNLVSLLAGHSESREDGESSPLVTCTRGLLTSVKYAGDETQIHKTPVVGDKLLK